jgi:VIT1/CCC1 family predicted Fe2+/Mn2+ transporter
LYSHILDNVRQLEPPKTRLARADLYGAFVVFVLVSSCAIPAVVPFLFFKDPLQALRVSNLVLIGFFFLVGYRWAGDANINRWKAGFMMMVAGIVLAVIGEFLGG